MAAAKRYGITVLGVTLSERQAEYGAEQSALQFTRNQLDRLKIGQEVRQIPWGSRKFKLPESKLTVS